MAYELVGKANMTAVAQLLRRIIGRAVGMGLQVVAVSADMGNPGLWKALTGVPKGKEFVIAGQQIRTVNDPQHLLKNIRSGAFRYDILLGEEIVTKHGLKSNRVKVLQYLSKVHDFDEGKVYKLHPGLSKNILMPSHYGKMRVGPAKKVFSRTSAAAVMVLVENGTITEEHAAEATSTAWFILKVAEWFEVMSSRVTYAALQRCNDSNSECVRTLSEVFTTMRVVHPGTEKSVTAVQGWKHGTVHTNEVVLHIANDLFEKGWDFLLVSRLGSDCIENTMGCIRNNVPQPTAKQVMFQLKRLLLSHIQAPVGSYDRDEEEPTPVSALESALETFRQRRQEEITRGEQRNEPKVKRLKGCLERQPATPGADLPEGQEVPFIYVASWCAHVVLAQVTHKGKHPCRTCQNCLLDPHDGAADQHTLAKFLEKKPGGLKRASQPVIQFLADLEADYEIIYKCFYRDTYEVPLQKLLVERMLTMPSKGIVDCHNLKERIVKLFARSRCHWHASRQTERIPDRRQYASASMTR